MNILNGGEMVIAENAACDFLAEVDDAETLLRCAWERFFDGKTDGLDAGDAMELGVLLRVCCDRLFSAGLVYQLAIGMDGPGVASFFDAAGDYREARELQELNAAALNRARELSGTPADALTARRMEALRLPVPDGIKLLRAALKGGEA